MTTGWMAPVSPWSSSSDAPSPVWGTRAIEAGPIRIEGMTSLDAKFAKLGTDHAPGQEVRQGDGRPGAGLRGGSMPGTPVDFSHGDVNDTAFPPAPGALEAFLAGERRGGSQAYTEYRGGAQLREHLARKLGSFTGAPISAAEELIITPGTQGALFLAL